MYTSSNYMNCTYIIQLKNIRLHYTSSQEKDYNTNIYFIQILIVKNRLNRATLPIYFCSP